MIQRAGARVIKVEDPARPDGARAGSAAFFDLLNEDKQSVALDFASPCGRALLVDLLDAADVIVTSSRARAFEQIGILPGEVLRSGSDKVWTAITAYGWSSNRVGFGDDVAAGVGLVALHPVDGEPRFASDAVADPLCGLEAAELTLDCLARGGRWFVDASLAGAASKVAVSASPSRAAELRDGHWEIDGTAVQAPRARSASGSARPLGADTEAVLTDMLH
jgi:crotonobetainyl-CoA:carnitine CoA-transferase CaiB-like acyl-CoA transferase